MIKFKVRTILFLCLSLLMASCGNNDEDKYDLIPVNIGDKWGYINQKGEILINPQFATATTFSDDRAAISVGEKFGFINEKGEYIISPIYKNVTAFSEGIAWTVKEGGYPVAIDNDGEELFSLKEAVSVYPFKEGLARFGVNSTDGNSDFLYGFVNKDGEVVISPTFSYAYDFSDGLAGVTTDNENYGYIDKKGKIVVNPQFNKVQGFVDGKAVVSVGDMYGIIDEEGKYILNPQFEFMKADGDLFCVKTGDKVGWCDSKGKYVINPQFDDVGPFLNHDLAPVKIGDKYGFIDKTGKIAINPQFDTATHFLKEISAVSIGYGRKAKWGFIDKDGNYVITPQYSDILGTTYECIYSDFFDIALVVTNVKNILQGGSVDGMNFTTTVSAIKEKYSLTDSDLNKYSTTHSIKRISLSRDADLAIKMEGTIFNRISNGWWGYTYVLLPNATPSAFICNIELHKKGYNKEDKVFEELKKEFKLDAAGNCKLGSSNVQFTVVSGKIAIRVTPA